MEKEKRFNENLNEEYENKDFRPLSDNRESVRKIREQFSKKTFPTQEAKMSDEQIKKVMENMADE